MRWLSFAGLALLAAAVAGCDPQQSSSSQGGQDLGASAFDPTAPRNKPEPAVFGKPGPAPAEAAALPAVAQASFAAQPSGLPAPMGELSRGFGDQVFDGARPSVTPVSFSPGSTGPAARAPVTRTGKMSIDTDGAIASRSAYDAVARKDRWRSNHTSLRYSDGRSLDPTRVPYVVIPDGFQGARLGDLAYVQYGTHAAWAVVGDVGPAGHFGEGSSALAAQLGIPNDGLSGGVNSGVRYSFFPGTSTGRPQDEAELSSRMSQRVAELQGQTALASL